MYSFETLFNDTIREFKIIYGEKKYQVILEKLTNSKSIKENHLKLLNSKAKLNSSMVIAIVSSMGYIMFSNKRNTALACLLFIDLWNKTINTGYLISSDEELINLANLCFEKSSRMLW